MSPELVELDRQFAAAEAEASELTAGLLESQFNWRPDPSSWSMAECLQHLNMVGERCVHMLEATLADARARGRVANGPFGYGWLGKWVLARTEPPSRHKYKAPRAFTPAQGQPITAVLPAFRHLQEQLSRQLEQASGLDLAHIRVPAPEARPLRFNLQFTFAWIAAHERRHLWQARQVRNHAAFPAVR
ncbi:MAG: DinB family protein [Bryobacteraceae bacterium]